MRLNFDPERPLADEIRVVENAVVVPWGRGERRGMARPAGVFTAEGEPCAEAQCWRSSARPATVPPEMPDEAEIERTLPGTVLFGGLAYGHFGHALCESTARLWALSAYEASIDSLLFMPKKRITWPNRSLGQVKNIAGSLGIKTPIEATNAPVRVERLVVAPQGFGVGNMIGGSPEFRAFADAQWRQRVQAEGAEKIYISRTEVFRKRGRLLLEEYIEDKMRAEGFEIFHPQQHDLATQLARYKAAKMIVSTDNSALHLAAFVAMPDCKIGILLRRPGNIFRDFQEQLRRFAGIDPLIVNACQRYWFRKDEPVQFNEIIALADLEKIGRELAQAGFIGAADWRNPTPSETDKALKDFEEKGEMRLAEVSV